MAGTSEGVGEPGEGSMTEARPAPPSVGKLEKYVLAYANSANTAVGRVRHWIWCHYFTRWRAIAQGRFAGPGGPG